MIELCRTPAVNGFAGIQYGLLSLAILIVRTVVYPGPYLSFPSMTYGRGPQQLL